MIISSDFPGMQRTDTFTIPGGNATLQVLLKKNSALDNTKKGTNRGIFHSTKQLL